MQAVDRFCRSIDGAGIRDRFFRLNLFCGTGLSAALVPLYRGQSASGTQFGGTTDTNNNFVSGDYSEASGLKGNGSTKSLLTGVLPGDVGGALHLAVSVQSDSTAVHIAMGCDNAFDAGFTQAFLDWQNVSGTRLRGLLVANNGPRWDSQVIGTSDIYRAMCTSTRATGAATVLYHNGVSVATVSPTYQTLPAFGVGVFGLNRKGTVVAHSSARLSSYSIGENMTATQAASYNTALVALLTALGRPTA
jgi:hypothetical protein